MKYISIDIETTGLDPEKHQILSFGAIIEDTNNILDFNEIPKFNAIIPHHELCGQPRALTMNQELISLMGRYLEGDNDEREKLKNETNYLFLDEDNVVREFFDFLWKNQIGNHEIKVTEQVRIIDKTSYPLHANVKRPTTITVAGKNFSTFDKLFLEKLPWWKKLIRLRQRTIDPSILFCDWLNDNVIPSLDECKKRAKMNEKVTHVALDDAWDVIKLLRTKYEK